MGELAGGFTRASGRARAPWYPWQGRQGWSPGQVSFLSSLWVSDGETHSQTCSCVLQMFSCTNKMHRDSWESTNPPLRSKGWSMTCQPAAVLCLIVLSGSHGSVEQGRKEEGGKMPREHAAFCRRVVALCLCDSVGRGICSGV